MIQNKFGEMIFSEKDVCDLLMQGRTIDDLQGLIVDHMPQWPDFIDQKPNFTSAQQHVCSVVEFHAKKQAVWHMPDHYKNLDIAEHVLNLCDGEAELQRVGQELMLYQERDLFDLLRYLKYLVDVMQQNQIIWGVGRGSSVSSFVLYKLGVHRINSLYYNLDVAEFLR